NRSSKVRQSAGSVAEAHTEVAGGEDDPAVQRHQLLLADDVGDPPAAHSRWAEYDERPEVLLRDGADRRGAEAKRQQPIERRPRPAPLQVTEYQAASLLAGSLGDRVRHLSGNPAQPLGGANLGFLEQTHQPVFGPGAFGDDDDREVPAGGFAIADFVTHPVDVEWNLRNENHVGAPRKRAVD